MPRHQTAAVVCGWEALIELILQEDWPRNYDFISFDLVFANTMRCFCQFFVLVLTMTAFHQKKIAHRSFGVNKILRSNKYWAPNLAFNPNVKWGWHRAVRTTNLWLCHRWKKRQKKKKKRKEKTRKRVKGMFCGCSFVLWTMVSGRFSGWADQCKWTPAAFFCCPSESAALHQGWN